MTTLQEAPLLPSSTPQAPVQRRARPTPAEVRRRELAAFLRSRRERIAPEQVGFPPAGRRRTPGLRREEVAQLAGVGVTWYTWLEQGRDIHVSEQVLDAVARTLMLDRHEREHLFTLAGAPTSVVVEECHALGPTAQVLLDKLDPYPALVTNGRYDILAHNDTYRRLIGDVAALPFDQRNTMWLVFTSEVARTALADFEQAKLRIVGQYRAAMADHVSEPVWKCLVKRLRDASPEFADVWDRHDVASPENLTKRFLHPDLGLMQLDYTNLWLGPRPGVRLVTYTPSDEETAAKLPLLSQCEPRPLY